MYQRLCLVLFLSLLALVSSGCGLLGEQQTTPEPIILIATPAPTTAGTAPTPRPAPPTSAAGPTSDVTPTTAAVAASATPETTASQGTITFAFDAFPSYYPGIIAEVEGLLAERGYDLELVPFLLNGENDFSEAERYQNLASGEWDVLATTLDGFARQSDPALGAITTVIDESAGADKLVADPEIATINDLRGKRIAYSEGSVGEYFLYYSLSLAGLTPADVVLAPAATVEEAVNAYLNDEVDAVSAWEPDVLAAEEQGATVLISSADLRAILDVLVTSRVALETKNEGMQAFHAAWYEALQMMIDSPDQAAQAISDWGNTDWTTITSPEDLNASLENIAQATLGANQIAFRNSNVLVSRLEEARDIWSIAGQTPPDTDLTQLVDGRYVTAAAENPGLATSNPPVNSSFLLTAQVDLPQLSDEEQQQTEAIVQLPLEQIEFEPDSQRLTEQAQRDLTEQVLPVLRSSRLYLKIEGSSAWPGPEGRFSAAEIDQFARERANSVATFLIQQGISANRLLIGTLQPQFPNSTNADELAQDRIVRFTLVEPLGR